ncbi:MAG: hypothetical protein GY729_11730 [Desulfobacteraceae bacterium]|nr:hypothetical protein [Desulfobacteraceae bacterium]
MERNRSLSCVLGMFVLGAILLSQPPAWSDQSQIPGWNDHEKAVYIFENHSNLADLFEEFPIADIYLEQNATKGDTEVVMAVKGGEEGLEQFWLFAPDGQVIYRFNSPRDCRNIGGRKIVIESPSGLEQVLNAYPEGAYVFIGKSFNDQWLFSIDSLSHSISLPPEITYPQDGDFMMPGQDRKFIAWNTSPDAVLYIVKLENKNTGHKLQVEVDSSITTFQFPEEWLGNNTEYQAGIFAVNSLGNTTGTEVAFYNSKP